MKTIPLNRYTAKPPEKGFGIIEIVVAVTIISIALFAISQTAAIYLKQIIQTKNSLKAAYYAEEALEAARSARDQTWANISTAGTKYPVISSGKWTLSATNPGFLEDKFSRSIAVSDVSRDGSDNITTSGGTNDPDTKKITATISWGSENIILTTYLTNLYNN